jgi:hypothetical protein
VAECCEYGDEPSGSCATELIYQLRTITKVTLHNMMDCEIDQLCMLRPYVN